MLQHKEREGARVRVHYYDIVIVWIASIHILITYNVIVIVIVMTLIVRFNTLMQVTLNILVFRFFTCMCI